MKSLHLKIAFHLWPRTVVSYTKKIIKLDVILLNLINLLFYLLKKITATSKQNRADDFLLTSHEAVKNATKLVISYLESSFISLVYIKYFNIILI